MITILLWHVGVTLLLAAALGGVSVAQWAARTLVSQLPAAPVQPAPSRLARPLVSGGAPRG